MEQKFSKKVEKTVLLQVLDILWREHLSRLEHLRTSVSLRGYAQRDPLHEYKTESFDLFQGLLSKLREQVTAHLIRVEILQKDTDAESTSNGNLDNNNKTEILKKSKTNTNMGTIKKVGRNEVCPCGSGKKFKHCHGKAN